MPSLEERKQRQVGAAPVAARWPRGRLRPVVISAAALHLLALAAVIVAPVWWPWVLGALAAVHLLLAAVGLWPHSGLLGPNITRLPATAAARGEIALTFDDGPDPEVTPAVLDILEAHGVHATFFCIGEQVLRHPAICREILRRGHAVESHSQRHQHTFSLLGPQGYRRELIAAQRTFRRVAGREPDFFRAPAGLRNLFLEPALLESGLRLVSWTRRGYDTRERRPEKVLRRLRRGLAAGDILLLHDGQGARTRDGRPVVLDVLPQLLNDIRRSGLVSVTLRDAHAGEPTVMPECAGGGQQGIVRSSAG